MKNIFFWSPHIDPQVATVKSVSNSIQSLSTYQKNINITLLNVFGEWDNFNFDKICTINLILHRKFLREKFKGFFNSRILYLKILFQSYFPLKRLIKTEKPDYLIIHLITIVPILLFILNNFQTRLVLRISGLPKLNFFRSFLWKIASKKIEYVICPTEETKISLKKKNIFHPEKIVCIPDPIISIKKINNLKKETLGEKIEKPYFLCIGRFTRQKNHLFLLNFFSKNKEYLKDTDLILIGDGELKKDYIKIIKKGKLENNVKILDYKKNVFNYIRNAKSIISSSLWEDPGFIMVEAASLGTPIISSNCPSGPKEFIGQNHNGFIYESNNEESFKDTLNDFIKTPNNEMKSKLVGAKKRTKSYTHLHNAKKLSSILIY